MNPEEVGSSATSDAVAVLVDPGVATERALAGDVMDAGEESFRALCMQAPMGIFSTSPEGSCTFVNAHWSMITGRTAEQAVGHGWTAAIHPNDRARVEREWQGIVAGAAPAKMQYRYRHLAGQEVWVVVKVVPTRNAVGALTGYLAAISDVTSGVLSEQRFAMLFEQSNVAHLLLDEHAVIVDSNHSAVRLLGAESKRDLCGLRLLALSPSLQPDGRPSREEIDKIVAYTIEQGSHTFEWTQLRRDGALIAVEIAMTCVVSGGRRVFFCAAQDLTERKRAEQAVVRSREAALEASRAKSQFLANMSHEIRTPMNGVLGMLQLALGTVLSLEQREFLDAAHASAEGLLAIINDILDLSKIEAGKLDVDEVGLSIEDVLRSSLQSAAIKSQAKAIELFVRIGMDVPARVIGDPVRIRQVLTNLIGNAVKFTNQGHVAVVVTVARHDAGPRLCFDVEDTGVGIPKQAEAHVFEAFHQADGSTTRRFGGTGLGLTISRQLVSLMKGQLQFESGVGKGSTFSFALPLGSIAGALPLLTTLPWLVGRQILVVEAHRLARESLAGMLEALGASVLTTATAAETLALVEHNVRPLHAVLIAHGLKGHSGLELTRLLRRYPALEQTRYVLMKSQERVDSAALSEAGFAFALDKPILPAELIKVLGSPSNASAEGHADLPEREGAAIIGGRSLNVLMVEDHPINAHYLMSLLGRQGHRVVHACNGVHALAAYERALFDIILMDVQMPEMDGLEATRQIRALERMSGRRVPIIALTANAMTGDAAECLAVGMDHYLSKPIDASLLQQALLHFAPRLTRATDGPRPPDQAGAPAFEREQLLQRAAGDPRFMAELIHIFLATHDEMLRDIEAGVADQASEALRDSAHRLKGALQLLCATPAATVASELERAARAGQVPAFAPLLRTLKQELMRLRSALAA